MNNPKRISGLTLFICLSAIVALGSFVFVTKKLKGTLSATDEYFSDGSNGPELKRPYLPGEELNFHFNLNAVSLDDSGNPDISVIFRVLNSQGKAIADPYVYDHKTNPDQLTEPVVLPIRFFIEIPVNVEGGNYTLNYEASDKIEKVSINGSREFQIRAPQKNSSNKLNIDLLSFVEGPNFIPTTVNRFTAGSEVRADFYATGFKIQESKPNLTLDLAVADKNQQILLEKNGIVNFAETLYEADFYIPMNVTVSTPDDIEAGEYFILLTLKDNLAQEEIKKELLFFIK